MLIKYCAVTKIGNWFNMFNTREEARDCVRRDKGGMLYGVQVFSYRELPDLTHVLISKSEIELVTKD